MNIFHIIGDWISNSYSPFFDYHMWWEVFSNPSNYGLIFTLVLMEGLLSADNAIALSVQVRHLPEKQRKKALTYGLWGAYVFRFIAIGMGAALTKMWWVKVLGGGYLLWMMIHYFMQKRTKDENHNGTNTDEVTAKVQAGLMVRYLGVFWATVISVELMDITFSVDSVLAAFGISDLVGILLLGGMLGILMMRGVAQVFTKLIDKVPELETTAYVIVGFIGFKMLLATVHELADKFFGYHMQEMEITHVQFFIFLGLAFAVTFFVHHLRKTKIKSVEANQ